MRLVLTPKILPDADSYNVIADWPGSDKAGEIVVVSGHLDSWDLATGAHDDAAGVASAMAVFETLKKLDYRPRRTIRMIAWMNEENGTRGARAYLDSVAANPASHVGAIESDSGAGRPFGLHASVPAASTPLFAPLQAALQPIGAGVFQRQGCARDRRFVGSGARGRAKLRAADRQLDLFQLPPYRRRHARQGGSG
ncbi:M20/M25/M40 family metallo-hydrolase [Massilia sp. Dwa41.01b]|uniref:M20/M25/M40 family metallo-hydrolase n=1 Tax=Massilia sp. Dwa41.01b TaxID=2709302 RepID=UPI0028050AB9|nr:M20/M25/M40 family metallo-hydrolase [Massilia sp. Dwa41.01b]